MPCIQASPTSSASGSSTMMRTGPGSRASGAWACSKCFVLTSPINLSTFIIEYSPPLSDHGSSSLGSGCLSGLEQGQEQVMHKRARVQHFNAEEDALSVILRRHIGTEFEAGAFLSVRKPQIEDIFVGKIHRSEEHTSELQ